MEFFCSFCNKVEEEVPLIEISSNLLFLNKCHYDFPKVFYDLFRISSEDLRSNFICETCKDSVVQFFVFKSRISCQMNQHLKMILTQVEDFLSQTSFIEEIQVIRKLNSITLQADVKASKGSSIILEESLADAQELLSDPCDSMDDDIPANLDDVIEEVPDAADNEEPVEGIEFPDTKGLNTMFMETNCCSKCDDVFKSNEDLDIHEFLKHSLLGIQIENDLENNEVIVETEDSSKVMRKCSHCTFGFEDSSAAIVHILHDHILDLLTNMNETLNVDPTESDCLSIHKFINHVKHLMQSNYSEVDEETKKKFFEFYLCNLMKTEIVESDTECGNENQHENVADSMNNEIKNPSELNFKLDSKQKKPVKSTVNLTDESRAWIKKEIALRKKATSSEPGRKRYTYQCAYCNKFSSNSAPGFRYHLVIKHLSEHNPEDLQEIELQLHLPPDLNKTEKNACFECNLKFKDQKLLTSHMNCHDLFAVIAKDYIFPSCNTCNKFFIDELTLERHLEQHSLTEDFTQSVPVGHGALVSLGKLLNDPDNESTDEIPEEEFSWKCGHCPKRFHKEELCRLHLLMFHVSNFICPIENREFNGFKAVSLFAHHLKNKHSHLFPEITFPCTFCKLEFASIYDKLSHMKSCSLKKFSCDHCGKKFFRKGDLVAHLKFVSGELFYPCRVCYKRCETMSDLKIHLRSHTKEKPFECSICSKTFRTLAGRSAHIETHNTSTLYNCFCGKTFKQRQTFRRHVKAIHETDDKTENSCIESEVFEEVDEDYQ